MRFLTTIAAISSLAMLTFGSTDFSSNVPGQAPGTAAGPTNVVTSIISKFTTTTATVLVPQSSAPATPPEPMVTQSLLVSNGQTFVPVTLWEGSTTRVIYPQNSTFTDAISTECPSGTPISTVSVICSSANGTMLTSTVSLSTSESASASASPTKTTRTANRSLTATASASRSEAPYNNGAVLGKGQGGKGSIVMGLGIVAGAMALL